MNSVCTMILSGTVIVSGIMIVSGTVSQLVSGNSNRLPLQATLAITECLKPIAPCHPSQRSCQVCVF